MQRDPSGLAMRNASRAGIASPPCHSIGLLEGAGAAVVQECRRRHARSASGRCPTAAACATRRRRRSSRAARRSDSSPMSWSSRSVYGWIAGSRARGRVRHRSRASGRDSSRSQSREQLATVLCLRVARSGRRDRDHRREEDRVVELLVGEVTLTVRLGEHVAREPDVVPERAGGLNMRRTAVRLPAKPAELGRGDTGSNVVRAAGDAVAVSVVRIAHARRVARVRPRAGPGR